MQDFINKFKDLINKAKILVKNKKIWTYDGSYETKNKAYREILYQTAFIAQNFAEVKPLVGCYEVNYNDKILICYNYIP